MRLLIANEGVDDAGGVDTYLRAIAGALDARGHQLAFLHYNHRPGGSRVPVEPSFGVLDLGLEQAIERVVAWRPDAVFSHNMRALDVDDALLRRWPVVKMMHGYFGTCISGQKAHLLPARVPCGKRFSAGCLAHFFPRRCGQADPRALARQYRWALRQRRLFGSYAAMVVASHHMRTEYVRNGAPAERVHAIPLFAPPPGHRPAASPERQRDIVLFLGRMTNIKGGDLLVRAVARASRRTGKPLSLVMAGDGPSRSRWDALARDLGVRAEFPGWVDASARSLLFRRAAVLGIPSVWPEPFGLVGLEAAAEGLPAVAFDAGGIREWLHDGVNGLLVAGSPSVAALADALAAVCGDAALRSALSDGALAVSQRMTLDRHADRLIDGVLAPACGARVAT